MITEFEADSNAIDNETKHISMLDLLKALGKFINGFQLIKKEVKVVPMLVFLAFVTYWAYGLIVYNDIIKTY